MEIKLVDRTGAKIGREEVAVRPSKDDFITHEGQLYRVLEVLLHSEKIRVFATPVKAPAWIR